MGNFGSKKQDLFFHEINVDSNWVLRDIFDPCLRTFDDNDFEDLLYELNQEFPKTRSESGYTELKLFTHLSRQYPAEKVPRNRWKKWNRKSALRHTASIVEDAYCRDDPMSYLDLHFELDRGFDSPIPAALLLEGDEALWSQANSVAPTAQVLYSEVNEHDENASEKGDIILMMRELGMSDLSFLLTGEEGQWAQSNCAEPPVKVLRGDVAVYDGVVEEENKVSVEVAMADMMHELDMSDELKSNDNKEDFVLSPSEKTDINEIKVYTDATEKGKEDDHVTNHNDNEEDKSIDRDEHPRVIVAISKDDDHEPILASINEDGVEENCPESDDTNTNVENENNENENRNDCNIINAVDIEKDQDQQVHNEANVTTETDGSGSNTSHVQEKIIKQSRQTSIYSTRNLKPVVIKEEEIDVVTSTLTVEEERERARRQLERRKARRTTTKRGSASAAAGRVSLRASMAPMGTVARMMEQFGEKWLLDEDDNDSD